MLQLDLAIERPIIFLAQILQTPVCVNGIDSKMSTKPNPRLTSKYYMSLAEETEAGFQCNDLQPAYHAIKQLRGGRQSGYSDTPVT